MTLGQSLVLSPGAVLKSKPASGEALLMGQGGVSVSIFLPWLKTPPVSCQPKREMGRGGAQGVAWRVIPRKAPGACPGADNVGSLCVSPSGG